MRRTRTITRMIDALATCVALSLAGANAPGAADPPQATPTPAAQNPVAIRPIPHKPAQEFQREPATPGVVTTRQATTPVGAGAVFNGQVHTAVFGATDDDVWVLVGRPGALHHVRWSSNRFEATYPLARPALQGMVWDETGHRLIVARNSRSRTPKRPDAEQVDLVTFAGGKQSVLAAEVGYGLAGPPAIAREPDGNGRRTLVLPLTRDDALAIVDAETGAVRARVKTGIAPFAAAIDRRGTVAYVSHWGGRTPGPDELTAPRGLKPDADRVAIDDRGVATSGTVARVDLERAEVSRVIDVGLHPAPLLWDEAASRLYVGNGNTDTLSIIDTATDTVVRTVRLQPFARTVAGVAPIALALSPDRARLLVACGGINAVLVLAPDDGRILGALPTAWYPTALTLSRDGSALLVSTLLGVGSGSADGLPEGKFVHSYRGTVHRIDMDDALEPGRLAALTRTVASNNRLPAGEWPEMEPRPDAPRRAIPERAGEPSLIEHVVYIIKENRTYDQVFGDLPRGNGDPSFTIYGRAVTPNQHRLAEQFAILDNFYATGGNSGDGHQWVTQASETSYTMLSGYQGRSYPFDGSDPLAAASGGHLWDAALARGLSVRVYGEYIPRIDKTRLARHEMLRLWNEGETFENEFQVSSPIPALDRILARNFPSYTLEVPDVVRARIFLRDLRRWAQKGKMPNLSLLLLPCDHTSGTSPGRSTPAAMVADNDLALGQIVEALSASPFWKKMAIFVVEDDAQNGVDHVDGHRTVAIAISPYARRGIVDSTFYSQTSMVRTIGLILGLRPLSIFDLVSNDMRAAFHDTPDFTPCAALQPEISLFDRNPPANALHGPARAEALASAEMRWDVPDAVPSARLNRILWHVARGWDTPYPGVRHAVFSPLAIDLDDDER